MQISDIIVPSEYKYVCACVCWSVFLGGWVGKYSLICTYHSIHTSFHYRNNKATLLRKIKWEKVALFHVSAINSLYPTRDKGSAPWVFKSTPWGYIWTAVPHKQKPGWSKTQLYSLKNTQRIWGVQNQPAAKLASKGECSPVMSSRSMRPRWHSCLG